VVPAVSFQLDRQSLFAGPIAKCQHQGRQQQVVDSGVVRTRAFMEQGVGDGIAQFERYLLGLADQIAIGDRRAIDRQGLILGRSDTEPTIRFRCQRARSRVAFQVVRPLAIPGGARWKIHSLRFVAISDVDILDKNRPRDRIDGEVMHYQQEPCRLALAESKQTRAKQRSIGKIERGVKLLGERGKFRPPLRDMWSIRRACRKRHPASRLHPSGENATARLHASRPRHRSPVAELLHRCPLDLQQNRLVVVMRIGLFLRKKAALDRSQWRGAGRRPDRRTQAIRGSAAIASSATVGCCRICLGSSLNPSLDARATICMAMMESPPRAKKLS